MSNPRSDSVRKVAALGGRSVRMRRGEYLIEGPQAVREAVRFIPDSVVRLFAAVESANPEIAAIARAAEEVGREVRYATAEVLHAISSNSQGIVAVAKMALCADLAELRRLARATNLAMVLPEIADPGNLGTLIRIADAAGAGVVVVGEGSVELTNPKVIRSSAGSVFHVPIVADALIDAAIDALKQEGHTVVGADGHAAATLPDIQALTDERVSWMFGNEAHGLSEAQRTACDELAKVPLIGRAESLNVAAAAAICMYARVFAT